MVNLSKIKFMKQSTNFLSEVEERHHIKEKLGEKYKEPTGIRNFLLKTPLLRRLPFVRPGSKPDFGSVFL